MARLEVAEIGLQQAVEDNEERFRKLEHAVGKLTKSVATQSTKFTEFINAQSATQQMLQQLVAWQQQHQHQRQLQMQQVTMAAADAPVGRAWTEAATPQHSQLFDETGLPVLPEGFCFDTPMGASPTRREDAQER